MDVSEIETGCGNSGKLLMVQIIAKLPTRDAYILASVPIFQTET